MRSLRKFTRSIALHSVAFLKAILLFYVTLIVGFSLVAFVAGSIINLLDQKYYGRWGLQITLFLLFGPCLWAIYLRLYMRALPLVSFDKWETRLYDSVVFGIGVLPIMYMIYGAHDLWLRISGVILLLVVAYLRFHPKIPWPPSENFTLFLRRFGGSADRSVAISLLSSSPTPVVLLLPKEVRSGPWDPITVCFAGLSFLRPIKKLPVYFRLDDEGWLEIVKVLIRRATCVVVEVTEESDALSQELEALNAAEAIDKSLFILQRGEERSAYSFLKNHGFEPDDSRLRMIYLELKDDLASYPRGLVSFFASLFCAVTLFSPDSGIIDQLLTVAISVGWGPAVFLALTATAVVCVRAMHAAPRMHSIRKRRAFSLVKFLSTMILLSLPFFLGDWYEFFLQAAKGDEAYIIAIFATTAIFYRWIFHVPQLSLESRLALRREIRRLNAGDNTANIIAALKWVAQRIRSMLIPWKPAYSKRVGEKKGSAPSVDHSGLLRKIFHKRGHRTAPRLVSLTDTSEGLGLKSRSASKLNGSGSCISIETEGGQDLAKKKKLLQRLDSLKDKVAVNKPLAQSSRVKESFNRGCGCLYLIFLVLGATETFLEGFLSSLPGNAVGYIILILIFIVCLVGLAIGPASVFLETRKYRKIVENQEGEIDRIEAHLEVLSRPTQPKRCHTSL